MKLLSIGLSGATENIRDKLEYDCKILTQEGFRVVIEESERGGYTFLGLHIVDGELSFRNFEHIKAVLKNSVSKLLADWIINYEERRIVNKVVSENYFYFNQDERDTVEAITLRTLTDNSARYKIVLTRITEYLDDHYELVLDGFLRFRLKDYQLQLLKIIDHVVDDFMMEFEYKEFVRLLRYFVDMQEPRAEEAHVVIKEGNMFTLFDSQGKLISNQYLEDMLLQNDIVDTPDNLNYEDLLISTLIMLAPRNIMVHSSNKLRDQELVDTVKNVFEDRVIVCKGCEMCSVNYVDQLNPTEL